MGKITKGRSPGYYIRKRLFRNKPAVLGLSVIMVSVFIAIFAYPLMPDSTPDANDGAVQLGKQTPGFRATLLKFRKTYQVPHKSWIRKIFEGRESEYMILPVKAMSLDKTDITVTLYGKGAQKQTFSIITMVFPPYTGQPPGNNLDLLSKDSLQWSEGDGHISILSLKDIQEKFLKENIEERVNWLGTDRSGRDILSRLIFGTRISLSIGFIAVVISMVIGFGVGSMAGFIGGRVDRVMVWFMSVVWSIPGIMLVIAITMALQTRGVWVAYVAVGLTMWVDVARVVRGQILGTREKLFVEAARALGASDLRIVYMHVMPNILGPVIVVASSNFAAAILLEAGLSFLGLSVQPPTPSWGMMIFEGFIALGSEKSWHMVLFPGLAISIMVLAFNIFGIGLRDAIDPKSF